MANEEQRILIKMTTGEIESLINRLEIAVDEARDHGLNQVYNDLVRNIEITVVPTTAERGISAERAHIADRLKGTKMILNGY